MLVMRWWMLTPRVRWLVGSNTLGNVILRYPGKYIAQNVVVQGFIYRVFGVLYGGVDQLDPLDVQVGLVLITRK